MVFPFVCVFIVRSFGLKEFGDLSLFLSCSDVQCPLGTRLLTYEVSRVVFYHQQLPVPIRMNILSWAVFVYAWLFFLKWRVNFQKRLLSFRRGGGEKTIKKMFFDPILSACGGHGFVVSLGMLVMIPVVDNQLYARPWQGPQWYVVECSSLKSSLSIYINIFFEQLRWRHGDLV